MINKQSLSSKTGGFTAGVLGRSFNFFVLIMNNLQLLKRLFSQLLIATTFCEKVVFFFFFVPNVSSNFFVV